MTSTIFCGILKIRKRHEFSDNCIQCSYSLYFLQKGEFSMKPTTNEETRKERLFDIIFIVVLFVITIIVMQFFRVAVVNGQHAI